MNMNHEIRACVASIAGHLITGKRIHSLYDYSRYSHIEVSGLIGDEKVQELSPARRSQTAGSGGTKYRYCCSNGCFIDLTVKGNTFIGYVRERSYFFAGNVRGESIYLFDHGESSHFTYRINGRTTTQEDDIAETPRFRCHALRVK
jgi:hypothetical protein